MAIKLTFDPAGNLETPTLVLALRSGKKIGVVQNPQDLIVSDSFGNAAEFTFSVIKTTCKSWYLIRNLRLIWVREWDKWFELNVDINEDNKAVKNVIVTHLPEAELSQINLYGVEINTDADTDREDYKEPTIFFNEDNTEASLLHRITKEAVNFRFGHIDDTLKNIQRTFTFDKKTIYDAFKEIEEEIGCHFEFNSYTENGKIIREINAYDLENFCQSCQKRFEYSTVCPYCDSQNVTFGYGEDTTVFLSLDNALDSVTYTTDVDSIKTCFKLETGDDLMDDTVKICNPNGTNKIWSVSPELLAEMSTELQTKISDYQILYQKFYKTREYVLDVTDFNELVEKYKAEPFNYTDLETVADPVGYPALMNVLYCAIDMELFLDSELMPSPENDEYTAETEMEKVTSQLTSIAIQGTITVSSASNAVLAMVKAIIMSGYQIKISDDSINRKKTSWTGTITITNYSDEEDTYSTALSVTITDDYEQFVSEKIQKTLAKGDDNNYGVVALFDLSLANFKAEIQKYGLQPLLNLQTCCEGVLSVLAEQGILNKSNYDTLNALDPDANTNLYNKVAKVYLNRQKALAAEIKVREDEIALVTKIQKRIEKKRVYVYEKLNFENYIGDELWTEFVSFRRDDVYSNSNYSSDGLTNAEIFQKANEFIEAANKEIQKAATPQHSVSVSMKNILIMPAFEPMKDKFSVGNWIRIEANEEVHKLRLLSYKFNYNDYTGLPVTFSDVVKISDDVSDISSTLQNAEAMSTSFGYVAQQASKGSKSYKVQEDWVQKGLDATALNIMNNADDQTMYFDRYGFLMRTINDFTGDYDPKQLKFINTTLAMTDDAWETVKTAVGLFQYVDPVDGVLKEAWGVNGEMLIGKLILGEELGIYNTASTLTFTKDGLVVTNADKTNAVVINPNDENAIFKLQHKIDGVMENVVYFDTSGTAVFNGTIYSSAGEIGNWIISKYTIYAQKSTQKTTIVSKPMIDENGDIIYNTTYATDTDGNPVYETDENGNIIYEEEFVYDEDGNPVYATDEDGNIIYDEIEGIDEEGTVTYFTEARLLTQSVPVQKTIQEIVYENTEEDIDEFENTYTILSSNDKSVAIAAGVDSVDSDGIPKPSAGKFKIYNNGFMVTSRITISRDTSEPCLYMFRKISDKTIVARMYVRNSSNPQFAFAFNKDQNNSSYTYSVIINSNGILPYFDRKSSLGSSSNRWKYIYGQELNVDKVVRLPSVLKMRDDLGRSRNVITLYHDGKKNNYGSNLVISAAGNTFIGSGNAPSWVYKNFYLNSVSEHLALCSDASIRFYVNCQKNLESYKFAYFDANLYFKPYETAKGAIGSSAFRWNNAYFEHSPTVTSDARHKTDIKSIDKAKELIMAIKPCQYRFKRDEADRVHYGIISQEFKQTLDELGIDCGAWTCDLSSSAQNAGHTLETAPEEEKMYGMRYEELIAPIIQVIQEQQMEIDKLKETLNQLTSD